LLAANFFQKIKLARNIFMFQKKIHLFQALAAVSLVALNPAQTIAACDPAVYSLSSKQLSFPSLAVEMYQPYTDVPDGTYTLCTGKGGPIVMNYQSLADFAFPYKRISNPTEPPQEMTCDKVIANADNCYPTYSGKNGLLNFPDIKVPWRAILPLGNIVEVSGSCYEAALNQGTVRPGIFSLIHLAEKSCP
jgi:hypothetical protein